MPRSRPPLGCGGVRLLGCWLCGGVLLSRRVAPAVPSALSGLASGFGMGTGRFPAAMAAATVWNLSTVCTVPGAGWGFENRIVDARRAHARGVCCLVVGVSLTLVCGGWVSPRPISTSPLSPSRGVHVWPINPMVCGGPYPLGGVGDLISKKASRLDAFSGYPDRT